MSWSDTAHDQGLKVKRHVVLIIDPRYNWGERMFLSFRTAPRLLPTLSLLTFLVLCACYKTMITVYMTLTSRKYTTQC